MVYCIKNSLDYISNYYQQNTINKLSKNSKKHQYIKVRNIIKNIDDPIFIGGIRRSGTSLVRSRISCHRKILGGPETFWFKLDFKKKQGRKNSKLDEHIINLLKIYNIKDEKLLKKLIKLNSKKEFLDTFFNYLLSKNKFKKRWVEKTTDNTFYIDYILKNWKKSLFIYVYRNPRSIFASLIKSNSSFNLQGLSSEIVNHYKTFNELYKKYHDRILIISYEEFVKNYDKKVKSLFEFIGEDFNQMNKDYLNDRGYELVKKVYNHESHYLLNIKRSVFKNRINPKIPLKNELAYKKISENLKLNENIISKYCDIKSWKL